MPKELLPLVSQGCFQLLNEKKESKKDMYKYFLRVSLIEIYNEEAIDLLHQSGRMKLKILDDELKGYSLYPTWIDVASHAQVMQAFNDGITRKNMSAIPQLKCKASDRYVMMNE